MRISVILLCLLLVAPLFTHAQADQTGCSCTDLQDKIRLIQESDAINYANLKAQIDMQQNATQRSISTNNMDLKNYIDANNNKMYSDMHHDLITETAPYKQVIPMGLASLTIIFLFITWTVWTSR